MPNIQVTLETDSLLVTSEILDNIQRVQGPHLQGDKKVVAFLVYSVLLESISYENMIANLGLFTYFPEVKIIASGRVEISLSFTVNYLLNRVGYADLKTMSAGLLSEWECIGGEDIRGCLQDISDRSYYDEWLITNIPKWTETAMSRFINLDKTSGLLLTLYDSRILGRKPKELTWEDLKEEKRFHLEEVTKYYDRYTKACHDK